MNGEKKATEQLNVFNDNINILIVEGRFYEAINDMLIAGATEVLDAARVKYRVITVPGALEVPQVINFANMGEAYDGAIALGCVIRGDTGHYDVVVNETNRALMSIAMDGLLPIGNGILTVENEAQAIERADPKQLNKGAAAANAVLSLVKINKAFMEEYGNDLEF